MARTEDGAVLTRQHRDRQMRIRAGALREFMRVWPVWSLDDVRSFDRLVTATLPLVELTHGASANVAAEYYEQFRDAEGVDGDFQPIKPTGIDRDQVAASLYATGESQARRSLAAGMSAEAARQNTLTTLTGAVGRHVLNGGRGTLLISAVEEPGAVGWQRVTDGDPCAFCAMLASRGPEYKSREAATNVDGRMGKWDRRDYGGDTARPSSRPVAPRGNRQIGQSYHDNCACSVEVFYEGSSMPPQSEQFRDMWDENARGLPADEARREFRRVYEGRA